MTLASEGEIRMRYLSAIVVSLGLVGVCPADPPTTRTVPVSDPNWFFSPYNWYVNGDRFAETQNTGAYFKVGFTGTRAALAVDVAMLDGVPASQWPLIRWQIDDAP